MTSRLLPLLSYAVLLGAACRSPEWDPSGFLGEDYEAYVVSEEGNLVWRAPDLDLSAYDSVLIDEVEVWLDENTRYRSVSWVEIRRYARLFEDSVRLELAESFSVVQEPGPTTLRIRLALTGVVPNVTGYSTRENLGYGDPDMVEQVAEEGTRLSVREVSVEIDFRDSISDDRLASAVVRSTSGSSRGYESWQVVEQVFAGWARRVREALLDAQA